jgi:flagellar FliJ protein
MKAFRFSLERALEWRRAELEQAEARFKQQTAELAAIDRQRAESEAADLRAEIEVRAWQPVSGEDLAALAAFRTSMRRQRDLLQVRRLECERNLAERQKEMMEARRRVRLLERLKERRLAEWQAAFDHELEQQAAESYLAQWSR